MQIPTKFRPDWLQLLLRVLPPVVLGVFAAPFLLLLRFASPAIDDFCKASLSFAMVPQPNALAVTWLYYTRWSPRWLTTLLQSLIMNHAGLGASYGWLLLLVILINLAALWYFFSIAFRMSLTRSFLAGAIFYAAWVATVAHLEMHLYFLTGAIEDDLSMATLLVLVSLLLQRRLTVWRYIAIALLSAAIPAQHEIAGTFLCMTLFAGIIFRRLEKLPSRQWYWSLGFAALSQAIVMISPGNAVRAADQHRPLWDTAHAFWWVQQAFLHDGPDWLVSPPILAAACCIVLLYRTEAKMESPGDPPAKHLAVACIIGILGVLGEAALIQVATGSALPLSVVAWLQFMFWLLFVCVVLTGIPEAHQVRFSLSTQIGVYVFLAMTLLGSTNFRWAKADLKGPAQKSHEVNVGRLRRRGASLVFAETIEYPHLFMPQYLSTDSQCWVNQCMANYLGAAKVVVINSAEGCLK